MLCVCARVSIEERGLGLIVNCFNAPFPASFPFIFVFSIKILIKFKDKYNMLMIGYDLQISGIRRDHSNN